VKRYLIACGVGFLIILCMFALEYRMHALATEWAALGIEIPLHDRILLGVAALWGHMWFLLSPVILAGCMGVAVLTDVFKPRS
jgi:hypothetical protein